VRRVERICMTLGSRCRTQTPAIRLNLTGWRATSLDRASRRPTHHVGHRPPSGLLGSRSLLRRARAVVAGSAGTRSARAMLKWPKSTTAGLTAAERLSDAPVTVVKSSSGHDSRYRSVWVGS
jgi:hypothetical protein